MLEAFGNIWEHRKDYDAIVVTTNGYVNTNGENIMGSGIALECKILYPWFPKDLGSVLKETGNQVYSIVTEEGIIYTLPTKHNWWGEKSDIKLIKKSIEELVYAVTMNGEQKVLLPRPGSGRGRLKWEDVKKVIEPLLDDRFTVMSFAPVSQSVEESVSKAE